MLYLSLFCPYAHVTSTMRTEALPKISTKKPHHRKLRKLGTDVGLKCKQKIFFLPLLSYQGSIWVNTAEICFYFTPSKPVVRTLRSVTSVGDVLLCCISSGTLMRSFECFVHKLGLLCFTSLIY